MDRIAYMASYLRGITFDGEKGKIIHYTEKNMEGSFLTVQLANLPEDEASLASLLKKEVGQNRLAEVVTLPDGGSFIIADSYDQALQAVREGSFGERKFPEGGIPAV